MRCLRSKSVVAAAVQHLLRARSSFQGVATGSDALTRVAALLPLPPLMTASKIQALNFALGPVMMWAAPRTAAWRSA